jgi:hypothetical protein
MEPLILTPCGSKDKIFSTLPSADIYTLQFRQARRGSVTPRVTKPFPLQDMLGQCTLLPVLAGLLSLESGEF